MGVHRIRQRAARWPQAKPLPLPQVGSFLLLLVLLLALSQALVRARPIPLPFPHRLNPPAPIWGEKPVLEYFVFTQSLAGRLPVEAKLSSAQMAALERTAGQEVDALRALELESRPIVTDPHLTLEQKRQKIASLNYNGRIKAILGASDRALRSGLGAAAYRRLVDWVERQWVVEKELHGMAAAPPALRTYRIFATRYDAGDAYYVALPDQCLKFTNGGNRVCAEDGYVVGGNYTVFMSYEESAAAVVGESGPWNIDDNFWATLGDPTPRRMFADLPVGMPEAQAAYFDGYNGGADQFGRQVTAPFGIDLARQVSIDIGLEPGKNDWIDVSFMWTEDWDSGAAAPPAQPGETGADAPAPPPAPVIIPVETAEPQPDGSIVHTVQEGQALWHIVDAYQVSLAQILALNGLTEQSTILPGQQLVIQAATAPLTPTGSAAQVSPTAVQTPVPTASPIPPPVLIATALAGMVPAGEDQQPGDPAAGASAALPQGAVVSVQAVDPILMAILALAVIGGGLILFGVRFQRKG